MTEVGEDAEKEESSYTVGMQADAVTLENSMKGPQKVENRGIYDPAIAILGIYPKDTSVVFLRGTCTPMFIAAISTIAKQ